MKYKYDKIKKVDSDKKYFIYVHVKILKVLRVLDYEHA